MKNIYRITLSMVLLAGFYGCNNDDPSGTYLNLSDEQVVFSREVSSKTVLVSSSSSWDFVSPAEWFTVDRNGNKLEITTTAYTGDDPRKEDITISSADGMNKTIHVIQTSGNGLVSAEDVTFRWKNAEQQIITVYFADADWKMEVENTSWLTAVRSGDDIVLTAQDNRSGQVRNNTIRLTTAGEETAVITVTQRDRTQVKVYMRETENMPMVNMSDNGRYIVGHSSPLGAFLWDRETDEFTSFGRDALAADVSDNGIVVGSGPGSTLPAYYKDGQWHVADMTVLWPEASELEKNYGCIWTITPDGSTMGGSFQWVSKGSSTPGTKYRFENPLVWRNGPDKPAELLENPEVDLLGESAAQGGRVHNISADGKVISGAHISRTNGGQIVFCAWLPEFLWPGKDYMTFVEIKDQTHMDSFHWSFAGAMSPSGEWITGYRTGGYPFRYNTKTRTFEQYPEVRYPSVGFITDEGVQFHFCKGDERAESYIWEGNRITEFNDWFQIEHNVKLDIDNLCLYALSADGKVFGGSIFISGNNFSGIWIEILD